jgi:hypothetical protein
MFSGAARCHATEASHIAKQLPSRRWAMTASADVLFHINNVLEGEDDDEYENEPRRALYLPGANCASNSSNRGSFRSGSHSGDFLSWP